jgi:hypothetical protein
VTLGHLPDGSYSYTATATDAAGNVSVAGGPLDFTVDTQAPPRPAIKSATLNGGKWELKGLAAAGTRVTIYDGESLVTKLGTAIADSTGAWLLQTPEDNTKVRDFYASRTDAAGNSSASPAWLEGTAAADTFYFDSEAALAAPAQILGNDGSDLIQLTAPATVVDADFAHAHSIMTLGLTGASAVTLRSKAAAAGIGAVTTGTGATRIIDSNTGKLKVNASALAAGAALTLSGSESFTVTGLMGNVEATSVTGSLSIAPGSGANTIDVSGHTRADTFVYGKASSSTGPRYDTITGANFTFDLFDVAGPAGTIKEINPAVTRGSLSTAKFNANVAAAVGAARLGAHDALLFTPSAGTLAGQTFLIVDLNGTAGYQANADLAVHLTGQTGTLGTSNFV